MKKTYTKEDIITAGNTYCEECRKGIGGDCFSCLVPEFVKEMFKE